MCEVSKENVIDKILSIPYEDWKKDCYDDDCIIKYYNYLREKMFDIFDDSDIRKNEYTNKKKTLSNKLVDFFRHTKDKKLLTDKLAEFQKASEALYLLNRVLLYNKNDNKKFERCFVATNAFINKLQNQYIFDISYQIQQKDGKRSICIALIALEVTVIFSIASILCTICDWKCKKSDLPDKIECLSDSIKTLNVKIDRQNEIVKEITSFQKIDSVEKKK